MCVRSWILIAMLLLCSCAGVKQSTDYSKLGLVTVSGTVFLEGQPLSGGSIYFESDDKTYSASNIDSSGQYSLRFNSEKMGVTPGPKTVRIRAQAMPTEAGGSEEDPDAKPRAVVSTGIPDCYDKASPIRVTVDASSSQFDFDLKNDCSTKVAK